MWSVNGECAMGSSVAGLIQWGLWVHQTQGTENDIQRNTDAVGCDLSHGASSPSAEGHGPGHKAGGLMTVDVLHGLSSRTTSVIWAPVVRGMNPGRAKKAGERERDSSFPRCRLGYVLVACVQLHACWISLGARCCRWELER